MYSREEAKRLKQEFWTAFGQYMRVVPSADSERVNWVNYKTGVKHLHFRMDVDGKNAIVALEMSHPDAGIRELMYEQLVQLRGVWVQQLGDSWAWERDYRDEYGKDFARVAKEMVGVNVHDRNDWPTLISFFKSNMLALDEFWAVARYSFEIFK